MKQIVFDPEDAFSITGRGTVVTGKILQGEIAAGDQLEVLLESGETLQTVCTGVEMFRPCFEGASASRLPIGILLKGISIDEAKKALFVLKDGDE